jgi:membrane protease subunit HflK
MTDEFGRLSTEEKVRRGVGRTLGTLFTVLLGLALLGAWAYTGIYQLGPGQAAVILRLGKYRGTETREGLRIHLPPPLEAHEIVNVGKIRREDFGLPGATRAAAIAEAPAEAAAAGVDAGAVHEAAMQTSDNNIVHLSFVVRYKIKDAFESRYRVAQPREILRDAAQAAVREVVGRTTIDGVLSEERGAVEEETEQILQAILDHYQSGLYVDGVELQEVQPPAAVRDAFDDVLAASQDRSRLVNEAQGYANEILPKARAEANELRAAAEGYREAKIAEATGEAERFLALAAEYQRAPEVTRRRIYLEAMEEVLPGVQIVIIEPGTASVLPYLPLGREPGGKP